MQQLGLFGKEVQTARIERPKGGSQNPIVFHDYESYIAKFKDKPKTTDDTFTPHDVYEAVLQYVGTVTDMTDKVVLRPFFPGGDYENAEYPANGVVIDNPPFSIFTKICRFYTMHNIPFFLFGPGLTIASCCKYCTVVVVKKSIEFKNGAKVKCNFASNLYGNTMITTAPLLQDLLSACPSQNKKVNLTKYKYPDELLSVSEMQTICNGGIEFSVSRDECELVYKLDMHPSKFNLFGDHFLISSAKSAEKEAAKKAAKKAAEEAAKKAAEEAARTAIPVELSLREKFITERLSSRESD